MIAFHCTYEDYGCDEDGYVFSRNNKTKCLFELKPFLQRGYYHFWIKNKCVSVHRFMIECFYDLQPETVDHWNGISTDNRLCNLRCATRSENQWNSKKRKDNRSGHKNISYDKKRKEWRVKVRVHGVQKDGGRFKKLCDAITSRNAMVKELHGSFGKVA